MPGGQFGQLGEPSADGQPLHRMPPHVLQHGAREVTHVQQGDLRQPVLGHHRLLRGRARAPRDMPVSGRERHVHPAADRVDPGRAGVGHHDARRAQDRDSAQDAQANVPRETCDLLTVVHRDRDLDVAGATVFRRHPRDVIPHHLAGNGVDRGLSDLEREPGECHRSHAGPRLEHHPGPRGQQPYGGPHQGAVGDVRIVARVLDHACRGPSVAELLHRQREGGVWPLGRVMVTGSGNSPVSSAVYAAVVAAVAQAPVVHPGRRPVCLSWAVRPPCASLLMDGPIGCPCTYSSSAARRRPAEWRSPWWPSTGSG